MASDRPILRWAGSKRQLLPKLSEFWSSQYTRYVEPFGGSCSLFFRVRPRCALLADKNAALMETYEVLRDAPVALHTKVAQLAPISAVYLKVRQMRPKRMSRLDRAARFIYLNRNCFNGIYRTNSRGDFNVPFAKSRQGALPTVSEFLRSAEQLQAADLRAWDFGTTLRHCREGDFVYLDPPYFAADTRIFRAYGPKEFGPADLTRLAKHLRKLHARGAKFLLSYADTPDAAVLKKPWRVGTVTVRRNVAGFVGSRRKATELLITNIGM